MFFIPLPSAWLRQLRPRPEAAAGGLGRASSNSFPRVPHENTSSFGRQLRVSAGEAGGINCNTFHVSDMLNPAFTRSLARSGQGLQFCTLRGGRAGDMQTRTAKGSKDSNLPAPGLAPHFSSRQAWAREELKRRFPEVSTSCMVWDTSVFLGCFGVVALQSTLV